MTSDARPLLVITARVGSSRLPKKVLKPIYKSYSILEFLIRRLKGNYKTSRLVLSTGDTSENDAIEKIGHDCDIKVVRGPENNVLERVRLCLEGEKDVNIIGRITADNPLTDPDLILLQLKEMLKQKADYSYCLSCPTGVAADLWTSKCFNKMYNSVETPEQREHINAWIWENPEVNNILWFEPPPLYSCSNVSVTIDTKDDFDHVRKIIENSPNPVRLETPQIINFYV